MNKNRKAHLPVVGDIKDALTRLNAMLAKRPLNKKHTAWLAQIDEWKKKAPFAYRITPEIANSDHMKDHMQGHEERSHPAADGHRDALRTDQGRRHHHHRRGPAPDVGRPMVSNTSTRASSSPAAASARWATAIPPRSASRSRCPDKQVIDIDGDGSFLMNIQELATAHIEKIAAKAIILNNQHLGMVVQWEDNFYGGNRGHTYLGDPEHRPEIYPDYVRVCNSFGVKCERVMFKKDLRAAIQRMLDAERTLRPRRHHALQHARHPVHPRRQDRGGHDLEGVTAILRS